jgi:TonB-dependent receptor
MNHKKIFSFMLVILYFVTTHYSFAQQELGTIKGVVRDSSTKELLPGASVVIKGTTKGAYTDFDGNYELKVSPGTYLLVVSFTGYKGSENLVTVKVNQTSTVNVVMTPGNQLDEIVISVQVKGQLAAIREQVSSNKIVNLVSAEKMQELPDANVAEALGRLPGISLQRSSGEAQKIIIRGVAPENNNITIAGVKLASNNASDRSVDLSMLQNEMFSGAEVSKTLRPDMEASAIGGTIDLRLAKANDRPSFNALYEGGYNNLFSKIGDTKFSAGGSARFFNNKFGVKFQGSYEEKLVSSHNFNGQYSDPILVLGTNPDGSLSGEDSFISRTTGAHMSLNNSVRTRIAGNLTLDYKSPLVDISLFNLINFNPNKSTIREEIFNFENARNPFSLKASENNNDKYVSTHLLETNFRFLNTELSFKLSYSNTKSDRTRKLFPFKEVNLSGETIDPNWLVFKDPKEVLEIYGQTEILNNRLTTNDLANDYVNDDTYNLDLKWKIPFKIESLNLDGKLTVGGLLRRKERSSDTNYQYVQYQAGSGRGPRNVSLELFPWMDWPAGDLQGIPSSNFIDQNYNPGEFLNGEYELSWSPDINKLIEMQSELYEKYPLLFNFQGLQSYKNDYINKEELFAAFIMFELKIGSLLVLPGIRMEAANTSFSSYSIVANGINTSGVTGTPTPVSSKRENEYSFPSLNMKLKLNNTLSLRGAIFKSISRPNFNNLSPRTIVDSNESNREIDSKNPLLRPSIAWNYDFSIEAYNSKLGLITINPFYKRIEEIQVKLNDYFPLRNERIVNAPSGFFNSIPAVDSYPTGFLTNSSYFALPINNPDKAEFYGVEFSVQTNLRYLKNKLLKGFVFDLNLSFINSKTKYPYFKEVVIGVDNSGFFPQDIIGYEYSTREGKMSSQPDFIGNVIIGWDYKGFSSRISYRRQGVTVSDGGDRLEFKQNFKDDLELVDISLRQRFYKNFELFLNANNITNYVDERFVVYNNEHRLPLNLNYFGNRIKFGLRYRF